MDAELNETASLEGDNMILEILLSIVIAFGASGPTGDFNQCPTDGQPATVQQG
jgi:hypothetical protein